MCRMLDTGHTAPANPNREYMNRTMIQSVAPGIASFRDAHPRERGFADSVLFQLWKRTWITRIQQRRELKLHRKCKDKQDGHIMVVPTAEAN